MSTQFFNSFRSENKSLPTISKRSFSKDQTHQSLTKRGRLRRLIQEKIMKKYNLTNSIDFIEKEINTFINCDNLSDKDLKLLDRRIHALLKEKGLIISQTSKSQSKEPNTYSSAIIALDNNRQSNQVYQMADQLNTLPNNSTQNLGKENIENKENNLSQTQHGGSQRNIMSGASHLSQVFKNPLENQGNKLRNDPYVPDEELIKPKKRTHRYEYEHEEDMWNAFNNVNRRIFEQEKIDEKQKDSEIKRRTKEDLDNQIKQRLLRLDGERNKESEYHGILIKHIDHLNFLEDQKQSRIKAKILKEKENRDKQMWDQNYKKKVEKIKMRKYENQLLNYIRGEIQNEKDAAVKKKKEAIEQLRKTIDENEQNKIKRERLKQEEVEDDIRCAEEYNRILEKQENDRINYFKNIEMKSTDFMAKMTETVLKDLKEKNEKAEQRMNEFLKKKEEKQVQAEVNDAQKRNLQKKEMKGFWILK